MLSFFKKLFYPDTNLVELKRLAPIVETVSGLESQMEKLSDDELKAQTQKLRDLLAKGLTIKEILPEAFATVREASRRVLKMRHFDVQILGGIVLFEGKIAEMKTGEGKTLTATLPLYLHGLTQKGAVLVTANDYLAKRDAAWMGELYTWLGLSVGVITGDASEQMRKEAYQSDITYATSNEIVFDYLRDNMKFSLSDYVQKEPNFCIVDEVDSILIDEARTPLMISGPTESNMQLYEVCNKIVPNLVRDVDFTVDEKVKSVVLTDEGGNKLHKILNIENLYSTQHGPLLHHLNQALRAHFLFTPNVDYVVKENNIVIVDELTGRLKEGSRWSDGLHQALEAKENLPIKRDNQTLATITFQNYFKLYKSLAGMTGTAETEAEEFRSIYHLTYVSIPTNMPMIRVDEPDVIYKNATAKYNAVSALIEELHAKGQPVLVGTISIENSERISKMLTSKNIPHQVLNAKQHENEANIIAQTGAKGMVTIATNMAGRGTDIKLTEETKELGGLYILGTERHESRRIDNQLRGRAGRQGDMGRSKFFLSLEDDLMRIFGSERIKGIMNTLGMKDDEPIEHKMITNAIARAQRKVESNNFEMRKHLLEYDNVMNEQRKIIYRLRKEILGDVGNMELINEMVEDLITELEQALVPKGSKIADQWNWEEINRIFKHLFNFEGTLTAAECESQFESSMANYLIKKAKDILEDKLSRYEEMRTKLAIREILLMVFDGQWKAHLLAMDHLKDGINLRAYAQKNPLNEYKKEGFQLFQTMRRTIKQMVVETIYHVEFITEEEAEKIKEQKEAARLAALNPEVAPEPKEEPLPVRERAKIGRNDPCPCGSGKKFKQCHGA